MPAALAWPLAGLKYRCIDHAHVLVYTSVVDTVPETSHDHSAITVNQLIR